MNHNETLQALLQSPEPEIRYKAARLLGEDAAEVAAIRQQITASRLTEGLLAPRLPDGTIPGHPYKKWDGAHWVLAQLADQGYPPGDETLILLRKQVLTWLLSEEHLATVQVINGRARRCASQESNAIYALLTLELADERVDELVRRLLMWQWPDGGWNCDRNPEAHISSFHESWIPLRALSLYARLKQDSTVQAAVECTAELFLSRRLFRRLGDSTLMHPSFRQLAYPYYWHYSILGGLKVLAEAGSIHDPRCAEALDWLEERQLPSGGWPATINHCKVKASSRASGIPPVSYGGVSVKRLNEFVTVEALEVLSAAGRL